MNFGRMKIALCLLLFLFGFSTFALLSTKHITGRMAEMVRQAHVSSVDGETISAMESAWEHYEPILDLYSRHDEVERISQSIEKLRPLYNTRQYTELRLALYEIDDALDHLVKTETPAISNIL